MQALLLGELILGNGPSALLIFHLPTAVGTDNLFQRLRAEILDLGITVAYGMRSSRQYIDAIDLIGFRREACVVSEKLAYGIWAEAW